MGKAKEPGPTRSRHGSGEPRVLLGSLLTLGGVYVALLYLLPHASVWLGRSPQPAPVPAFARAMYLACTLVGILVYVSSEERRWRLFAGPLVRLLVPPDGRSGRRRTLLLVALPLLAGGVAWRRVLPRAQPPSALRVQHPTMPGTYAELRNPYDSLPGEARERAVREGVVLYQKNCRPCHGTKADGAGPLARGLRLRPVDFTDPGTIATLVESYPFWRIQKGAHGLPGIATPWQSAMPAWEEQLEDAEIWKIILAEYAIAGREPRKPEGREP
ncbi:MAG: c-type cytochrome [Gemmatimonadota bacterium]